VVHCVTVAGAGERTCEAVQTVQVEGQAQPVAQLAIGRLPGAAERTLTAVLPVNIALAVAAHVSGNAKSGAEEVGGVDLAWQRCFAGSCAASNLLPERALASLRGGTAGRLNFTDAGGNAVGIPLSWKGLDQALSAMETMKQ
jgi:invasion protein IalB